MLFSFIYNFVLSFLKPLYIYNICHYIYSILFIIIPLFWGFRSFFLTLFTKCFCDKLPQAFCNIFVILWFVLCTLQSQEKYYLGLICPEKIWVCSWQVPCYTTWVMFMFVYVRFSAGPFLDTQITTLRSYVRAGLWLWTFRRGFFC